MAISSVNTQTLLGPVRFAARVAVVHGKRMHAELLRTQCTHAWGCEVVAVECSEETALAAVEQLQPDVVIISHSAPQIDAVELLPQLRARSRSSRLVVCIDRLSEFLVHRLSRTAFDAIVDECSDGLETLQIALERVRAGFRFLCSEYQRIASDLRVAPNSFPKLLSPRQEQVLTCIAYLMSDHEIGRALGMSSMTAQRHRADITHKVGLRGTLQLTRYAQAAGFNTIPAPCHRLTDGRTRGSIIA